MGSANRMADYFEEMGWRPLDDGEQPNHLLHMARFLLEFGMIEDSLSGEWPMLPPPASKSAVESLKEIKAADNNNKQCPVCLKDFIKDENVKQMPCDHTFHPSCILTWLAKTNSCPCCRFELPTDHKAYENFKREKKRAAQRRHELDTIHDSMFS